MTCRSTTPWPDLWRRVSAAASRSNAARSNLVGCATLTLTELVELDLQLGGDLGGAFGEHLQQLGRDTGDLGLPVHDLTEPDPVTVR